MSKQRIFAIVLGMALAAGVLWAVSDLVKEPGGCAPPTGDGFTLCS